MMTSFHWKRKLNKRVHDSSVQSIFGEADDDSSSTTKIPFTYKRKKQDLSNNCQIKSTELKAEGIKLAENGCYSEAVQIWDKAISLTPSDAKLFEMKGQALLQMDEPFLAFQAARKAVILDPQWWVAHQTLGRSQLGIGEIKMAILSFSKAIHINPACQELWTDDLHWAVKLLHKQHELSEKQQLEHDNKESSMDISETIS